MNDLKQQLEQSSNAGVAWLLRHLQADGSFGPTADDIAAYYKAPLLLAMAGHYEEAHTVMTFIRRRFMTEAGDFQSEEGRKSCDGPLEEYACYVNGWIAMGAQRLGRFDVSYPARKFMRRFEHKLTGGCLTHAREQGDDIMDMLSTAHMGLVHLYFGRKKRARRAGFALGQMITLQPQRDRICYLRMQGESNLITDFPQHAALFHRVNAEEPGQLYFMLGYPIAFLCKLWMADPFGFWPELVRDLMGFALRCGDHIRNHHHSHKVAWAAALAARLSGDVAYAELASSIVQHLMSIQDPSGAWHVDQPAYRRFDQTAENAIWLREVASLL